MEIKESKYVYDNVIQIDEADSSRKYLAKVFTWMFVALGISAFVAYSFATNFNLLSLIVNPVEGGFTTLGYVAIFSPLAFSLVMSFGLNRLSYPAAVGIFIAYAVAIGVSLSIIGLIYTASSIFT